MADPNETVDDLSAEAGPPNEGAETRRWRRSVLLLSIAGALLLVGTVVVWASAGRDSGAEAASTGALPISDESASPAPAQVTPSTTFQPLVEVEEPPLEGELVATAKITDGEVEVWASPDDDEPAWRLPVPTEFWGDRHFLVIDEIDGWYKILVPVRPNESEGWIPAESVTLSATNFNVQISVSDRSLKVWEGEELVVNTTSAVGRDNAPTPLGNFYIRDVLPWDENSAYGPYVLALSAYSETIDVINGGEAVVAIHGTSRPELIGRAVSRGCIRLHNDDITLLAETVPVGTPVQIVS